MLSPPSSSFQAHSESALKLFLKYGLVTDPWLASINGDATLATDVMQKVDRATDEILAEPIDRSMLGPWPLTGAQVEVAVREVLLSSAAFDAYLQYGRTALLPSLVSDAERRVKLLVREGGLASLILAYGWTAPVENLMAVRFYRRMREDDFVSGRLHRPWVQRPLDLELVTGLALGHYELFTEDGVRWVRLTRRGHQAWHQARNLWESTGYARMRSRLLMVAQFAGLGDLDEVTDTLLPDFRALRAEFVHYAQPTGPQVLEIGSGTGALTVDAGLACHIFPAQLTCLDPSRVMTERALAKCQAAHLSNVRFVQGVAESMPFPDESFDSVLGFAVFQYTDRALAFSEAYRVLKPGACLTVGVPLPMPSLQSPLVTRWFKALKEPSYGDVTLCEPDDVPHWATAAGFLPVDRREFDTRLDLSHTELTVRVMLQFQIYRATLDQMPYQARIDLAEDLVGRGRYLLQRGYGGEMSTPLQWTRWRKPG